MLAFGFVNHVLLPFSPLSRILGLGSLAVLPRKTSLKGRSLRDSILIGLGLVLRFAGLL